MGMLLELLVVCVAVVLGIVILVNILRPIFKGIGWLGGQVFGFIGGEIGDAARLIGAVVTGIFYIPMVIANLIVGRWSACSHYGKALQGEIGNAGASLYRMFVGHPMRLVGLGGALDGIEKRMPAVVLAAPGADTPPARAGKFEGYKIVGSLPGGGSGAKLYIAEPDAIKLAGFERAGIAGVGQVVIKSFSLKDGSSLPQIVRESRSLDAAKKLRLILDHELAADRFYYVMRYVPGESLTLATRKLHATSPATGLGEVQLRTALAYLADLVGTLSVYHRGGLWHKDVKPDNIIIDMHDGRAHLVDFGLVSSLRSAMTLTTHGTEYFRDSEMVRLALKGVKVHEVDGTKFDLYGAGAVLYSVIEDSFPAHGVLSQFSKQSPEAVRWVVRRAMADYDKRYPSAEHMLADLRAIMACPDPFAMKPFELPSMRGDESAGAARSDPAPAVRPDAASANAVPPLGAAGARAGTPRAGAVRLKNWWTGEFEVDAPSGAQPKDARPATVARVEDWVGEARRVAARAKHEVAAAVPPAARRSAEEQLRSAKARLEAAQGRVRNRMAGHAVRHRTGERPFRPGVNGGVVVAVVAFGGAAVLALSSMQSGPRPAAPVVVTSGGTVPAPVEARLPLLPVSFPNGIDVSPAAAPEHVGGRVLLVNDVLEPWSDEFQSMYSRLVEGLRATGVEVLESDSDVELVARARLAVGRSPMDTSGAGAAAGQWLKENSDEADVLLWIAAAPSDGPQAKEGQPHAYVFVPVAGELGTEDAARSRNVAAAVRWALEAR
ncbi:MAG: serine/threonine protein kinase [Phycisphaerales bacterium]